jgi:hypothetical protein
MQGGKLLEPDTVHVQPLKSCFCCFLFIVTLSVILLNFTTNKCYPISLLPL